MIQDKKERTLLKGRYHLHNCTMFLEHSLSLLLHWWNLIRWVWSLVDIHTMYSDWCYRDYTHSLSTLLLLLPLSLSPFFPLLPSLPPSPPSPLLSLLPLSVSLSPSLPPSPLSLPLVNYSFTRQCDPPSSSDCPLSSRPRWNGGGALWEGGRVSSLLSPRRSPTIHSRRVVTNPS